MSIDAIIKALLKAVGFDPATFIPQFQKFVGDIALKVQAFDTRLQGMEDKLDRIGDHLHYIKPMMGAPTCEVDPKLLPPPLDGATIEPQEANSQRAA